jgi:predicted transcriptional regulator
VLQKKFNELDLNPYKVAEIMGCAYDHIRKVYNGQDYPGPNLLRNLCDYLKLDYEEMLALVNYDKAIEKGWVDLMLDEDPQMKKLKQFWKHLTPSDQDEIIDLVKLKAQRNSRGL